MVNGHWGKKGMVGAGLLVTVLWAGFGCSSEPGPDDGTGGMGGSGGTGGSGGSGGTGGTGGTGGMGGSNPGGTCISSQGESGMIVRSGGCLSDDAFCELRADGTYCTGSRPFICPEGQVRVNWTSCDFPEGGAGGEGGVGGEGGAP